MRQFWGMFAGEVEFSAGGRADRFKFDCRAAANAARDAPLGRSCVGAGVATVATNTAEPRQQRLTAA